MNGVDTGQSPEPFEHGVAYPPDFARLDLRDELLYGSQSNVTADHELGLLYAAVAYDKALEPYSRETDPTAAGEAAAKGGLRAAQAGRPEQVVSDWFRISYEELAPNLPRFNRERTATHVLDGRAFALMSLKTAIAKDRARFEARAAKSFALGDLIARSLHIKGTLWDPYATMLDRHLATFESVRKNGDIGFAIATATQGIRRALGARPEAANSPGQSRPARIAKHVVFVGKQVLMNGAALSLAVTRPLDKLPKVADIRTRMAIKLLG